MYKRLLNTEALAASLRSLLQWLTKHSAKKSFIMLRSIDFPWHSFEPFSWVSEYQKEEFSFFLSTPPPQVALESNEVIHYIKNILLLSFHVIIVFSWTIVFLMLMFVIISVSCKLVTFTETLVFTDVMPNEIIALSSFFQICTKFVKQNVAFFDH